MEEMLLAGDIGGTKVFLAVYSSERGSKDPLVEATYVSQDYGSFYRIVEDFLADRDLAVERASFGVAGPVVEGVASVTNLGWKINLKELQDRFGLKKVGLLNDVEAIANAVSSLDPEDVHILNAGDPVDGGAIGVIAPGTGLGESYLTWTGDRYQAHPSEGGHVEFAPTNEREIAMLKYLKQRYTHVSYERICSGMGIPNIYQAFKHMGVGEEPAWLREDLDGVKDPTPVIVNAARDPGRSCRLCEATLETFMSVLGSEAGNLALKILATAGIYLGGGIPPKILSNLEAGAFMQAFLAKGRMRDLLEKIPVKVILNPKAALIGAAHYGMDELQ
jgi:glucokinase